MLHHKVHVGSFTIYSATCGQNHTKFLFFFLFYPILTMFLTVTTKGPEKITTPERMMTFTMEGKMKHDLFKIKGRYVVFNGIF